MRPINLLSKEVAEVWYLDIGMLFIDGSHDYDSVMSDLSSWVPHVLDNGLIALHDVGNETAPGVDEALKRWSKILTPLDRANITVIYKGEFYDRPS